MARVVSVVILIAFAICLLVALPTIFHPRNLAQVSMVNIALSQIAGVFFVSVSMLILIILAVNGQTGERAIGLVIPLLSGLYLISPNWMLPLAIVIVTMAFMAERIARAIRRPPVDSDAMSADGR